MGIKTARKVKGQKIEKRKKAAVSKEALLLAVKYLGIFFLQLALSSASVFGVRPFGAGLFLAFIFLKVPIVIASIFYITAEVVGSIISTSLSGGNIQSAVLYASLLAGIVTVVTILGFVILAKTKRKKQRWWLFIMPLFVSTAPLILSTIFGMNLVRLAIFSGTTLIATIVCKVALKPIIIEKLRYKMLDIEFACLCGILVAAAIGVGAFNILGFPVGIFIGIYMVFCTAKIAGAAKSVVIALILGIGHSIAYLDFAMIAAVAFTTVCAIAFLAAPKPIMPIGGVVGFLIYRFLFFGANGFDLLYTIAIAAAGLFYIFTPKRAIVFIRNHLFETHDKMAVRYMLMQDRIEIAAKLYSASGIFRSMGVALSSIGRKLPEYKNSLNNNCCAICDFSVSCKDTEEKKEALEEMMRLAIESGRAAVCDIPEYLTKNCKNLAKLMSTASTTAKKREELASTIKAEKKSQEIISAQMNGMSAVLDIMAQSARSVKAIDQEREKILTNELNYASVATCQSVISNDTVSLIIRKETFDKKIIERVVSRVCAKTFSLTGLDDTLLAGFSCITLTETPKHNIVYGVAQISKIKGEKSGDVHSFMRIGKNKFLMALSDGMGSGENAEKMSSLALGLVENFYRAGFDSDTVLSSVNRFLANGESEKFSALDICVVDLDLLSCDIIKLASPSSFIKGVKTVERISGSSAPLGMLDTISPSTESFTIKENDIIVFVSDGVSECFSGDRLSAVINNIRTINPQNLAESILEQAINSKKGISDDATVIAARVIKA